jgi:hypothetical protein
MSTYQRGLRSEAWEVSYQGDSIVTVLDPWRVVLPMFDILRRFGESSMLGSIKEVEAGRDG